MGKLEFSMVISPALFAVVSRLHGSCCETLVASSPALGAAYHLRSHDLRLWGKLLLFQWQ